MSAARPVALPLRVAALAFCSPSAAASPSTVFIAPAQDVSLPCGVSWAGGPSLLSSTFSQAVRARLEVTSVPG